MLLTISNSESASSITPVEPLKPHFYTILKFIYYMLLTMLYLESAYMINPLEPLKPRFLHISEMCLLFSRKQQQILSYVVDNIIFRISIPDYPSRTVESKSLRLFCNFGVFCLLYIHITTINLHMTILKVRNSDSAYSICFSHVLLKLFTFLINTADKEICNTFNTFRFPYY